MDALDHPVYTGPPAALRRVQAFLKNASIDSRVTKSRKQCSILKVAQSNADRARHVLQQFNGPGRIMTSAEASFFSAIPAKRRSAWGVCIAANVGNL